MISMIHIHNHLEFRRMLFHVGSDSFNFLLNAFKFSSFSSGDVNNWRSSFNIALREDPPNMAKEGSVALKESI